MKSALIGLGLLLAGCSGPITQTVKPAGAMGNEPKEICVVQSPDDKENFLSDYRDALAEKGFKTRTVRQGASLADCPFSTIYKAVYRWDMRLYISYASIKVYRRGQPDGEAVYDASAAGATTKKLVVPREKIRELVAQLFPS